MPRSPSSVKAEVSIETDNDDMVAYKNTRCLG